MENPPQALLTYELCKTFGCLPSQLEKEDSKTIEELIVVMNAINEFEQKQSRAQKRQALVKKVGGAKRR